MLTLQNVKFEMSEYRNITKDQVDNWHLIGTKLSSVLVAKQKSGHNILTLIFNLNLFCFLKKYVALIFTFNSIFCFGLDF